MKARFYVLLLSVVIPTGLRAQFYNGSYQEFGQNRVQYNGFSWQSHDYERFKVYFNNGSKDLGVFAARAAQKHLLQIEKLLDFKIKEKIEFVVYNTQSAFRQSNVGLNIDGDYNIGGVTRLVGSKVFLYYEGTHAKLEQQIRGGIAHIILNMMMYGTSWREVFKNQTLVSLPEWYLQGFISYMSEPWSPEVEMHIKNGILSGKFSKFNHLEGDDARWAGHAIWNYIAEVKGENHLTNVLYMSRISKNVENGFVYTMGYNLTRLSSEFVRYYARKFELDARDRQKIEMEEVQVKQKKGRTYANFKLSPNGRYLAFTTHEKGQYKLWIYDFEKKKYKRIEKGEHKLNRIEDRTYPVLCWHPTGEGLTYMLEKKGSLIMKIYQVEEGRKVTRSLGKLEKILDFSYSHDGKMLAISGVNLGQTDLYLFKPTTGGFDQLTNDIYDDLYPEFVNKSTGIIFSSNRPSDTLGKKAEIKPFLTDLDVFVYELGRKSVLTRITQTPFINETQPAQYDTSAYTYLSDENGLVNRVVSQRDSAISHVDTILHYRYFLNSQTKSDYNHSLLEYEMNPRKGSFTQVLYFDSKWHFYKGRVKDEKNVNLGILTLTENRFVANRARQISAVQVIPDSLFKKSNGKIVIIDNPQTRDTSEINISDYIFKDEKPKYEKEKIVITDKNSQNKKDSVLKARSEIPFELPDQELYRINFATDYFATQLNFQSLNAMYQKYNGPGSTFENPGMNGLIKVGMSDVFEDYRLIGGFRYSADLTNNEYLMIFDDLSRRLDKRYLVYRQAYLASSESLGSLIKVQSYDTRYMLRWPFNEVLSVRGTLGYRYDRNIVLALDYRDLQADPTHEHRGSSKIEFIFDNTIPKGLNLYNGLRAKFFFEYYKDIFKEKTNFFVTGIDVRHYQKIHRCVIWASRLAGSASFGDQRLVYYLGGVDNWLARNRFDNTIQVAQDQNYAFQTLATPMRGFLQNSRNGSNFAVLNNEVRIPLFRYLANRPIKSDFFQNFQVVPFFDVGAAWTGVNPYSDKNSFNTTIYATPGNPIVIILENQREPIVYGYGWGLRSRIFGYFVRFDWARGIDDGALQTPIKYLSFSLDF